MGELWTKKIKLKLLLLMLFRQVVMTMISFVNNTKKNKKRKLNFSVCYLKQMPKLLHGELNTKPTQFSVPKNLKMLKRNLRQNFKKWKNLSNLLKRSVQVWKKLKLDNWVNLKIYRLTLNVQILLLPLWIKNKEISIKSCLNTRQRKKNFKLNWNLLKKKRVACRLSCLKLKMRMKKLWMVWRLSNVNLKIFKKKLRTYLINLERQESRYMN